MNQATGLDHVGIVGHDMATLAAAFEAAGFNLTPLARHAGGRTGNRCAMFSEGGYLEPMATVGSGSSATLDRFLARFAGAHILALGIDDETAVAARLTLAWGAAPEITRTEREVDDPGTPRARFSLIAPADRPEGRVHLIRHETPEALWQPRYLRHPNNVVALEEVLLAVPKPAVTAAWYSQLTGRPVVPDSSGGYALPLPRGRVRILPPGAFDTPILPCIAAITLRTRDGASAIRLLLGATDDTVQVKIGGVTIRFH